MYFATFDIDESDAEDLLFVYILEDEIDFIPSLFNDRINIPEKNNDLKYNKEKSILKDKTNAIEKQVIETRNTEKQSNEYSLLENNNNRKSKETKEDSNDFFFFQAKILKDLNKNARRYNDLYISVSSIAYLFGPRCYNFLRKYISLPHETLLRHPISPVVSFYMNSLIDLEENKKILDDFIPDEFSNKEIHITLAVDAASFKQVSRKTILKKFPTLKSIDPNHFYNSLFVFYVQPINVDVKPFPIHIALKKTVWHQRR